MKGGIKQEKWIMGNDDRRKVAFEETEAIARKRMLKGNERFKKYRQ